MYLIEYAFQAKPKIEKTLIQHISCECKCKFGGRKGNSNQKWNNNKCRCERKNLKEDHACKKDYIWNTTACSCENGKYLGNITGDPVIACYGIIKTTISTSTKSL